MSYISYSEFKIWSDCAYKHKLKYVDRINEFQGNEYTAFGTSVHSVCEVGVFDDSVDLQKHFEETFLKELQKLPEKAKKEFREDLIKDMRVQGKELALEAIPALREYFDNDFEVVSVEERLNESIDGIDTHTFKGFVDLVIKSKDKYHIIDWKTCGWGWDSRKKNDKMITYQLTFYKNYFAKKHGIDPADVETYFALLKRTAKTNKVEIFRVTSGKIKTQNALKMLGNSVHNIVNENYVKNRTSCTEGYGCEFYNTKHCQ